MTRQHISPGKPNIITIATLVAAVCTTLGLLGTALQAWALFSGEYSPWGARLMVSMLATGWLTVVTALASLVLGVISLCRRSCSRWISIYAITVGALPLLGVLGTQLL